MASEILQRLENELSSWRARLDEMRVQASLGKMELRDKLGSVEKDFDQTWTRAKREIGELKSSGKHGLDAVLTSLEAGWDEARKTFKDANSKE